MTLEPREARGPLRCVDFVRPHDLGADAEVLREAADWLDMQPEGTVLIGLWSTGFGDCNEICVQMVVDQSGCS